MDVEVYISTSSMPQSSKAKHGGLRRDVVMAYNTLGIVFGGVVTSPLYVYSAMNLVSPSEEDYLGIFSIMFWTLSLIGIVKYVCIALNADDDGEGGTFALYSLLCKNAKIGTFAQGRSSNADFSGSTQKQGKLQRFLERSISTQRVLFFIAMLGMCMLIGDGILTPAISVLSAIDGLRRPFPSVGQYTVEALSVVILVTLFLLQRFGTSHVSFLFSPIMAAWTFSTPAIGVYRIVQHYPGVLKAISPHYVVQFFQRNGSGGWRLLSGIVLCITGAEAMFADLGHFNKRSIQIAFVFMIYPSLVLTYAGQTAYLIMNADDHADGFFKFVPGPVYWPMFIVTTLAAIVASQSLISATFSVVKQAVLLDYFPRVTVIHTSRHNEGEVYSPEANCILMILCVSVVIGFQDGREIGNAFGIVVILVMVITTVLLTLVMLLVWRTPPVLAVLYLAAFLALEGAYVSAVMTKFLAGGWLPFTVSVALAVVVLGWCYGRQRRAEHEAAHGVTVEHLAELLSTPGAQRAPGLCLFYAGKQDPFPPVLGHCIRTAAGVLRRVTVFVTFRYLPVDHVPAAERLAFRGLAGGVRGVYGCTVHYGYADTFDARRGRQDAGSDLVAQVVAGLKEHILANQTDAEAGLTAGEEVAMVDEAVAAGVVHVRGRTRLEAAEGAGWVDRVMVGFYEFLHRNCRPALPRLELPAQDVVEIGMICKGPARR
ncbi:hypothetical protein ACP70R_042498 [Stipagrostis hirtigluma subsp. patula]